MLHADTHPSSQEFGQRFNPKGDKFHTYPNHKINDASNPVSRVDSEIRSCNIAVQITPHGRSHRDAVNIIYTWQSTHTQSFRSSWWTSVCISVLPNIVSPPRPANSWLILTRYPARGKWGSSLLSESKVCWCVCVCVCVCVCGSRESNLTTIEWQLLIMRLNTRTHLHLNQSTLTLIDDLIECPACCLMERGTLLLKPNSCLHWQPSPKLCRPRWVGKKTSAAVPLLYSWQPLNGSFVSVVPTANSNLYMYVGRCPATKVFIGKLLATGGVWVIIE